MEIIFAIFRDPIANVLFIFTVIMAYVFIFLLLEAFVPTFKDWLDPLFILLLTLTLSKIIFDSFQLMKQLAEVFSAFFLALIPVLTSVMIVLQSVLAFVAWSPIVLFLMQLLMHLSSNVLIPALFTSLVFDFCTRFLPNISFKKLADLIRMMSMAMIAASSLAISMVLTFSGVAFFTVDAVVSSPLKKMVEQTIPFVGSIVVQGFSLFQKFQGTATTITGFTTITAFWAAAFYPAGTLLVYAFSCKFLGAITEPFTSGNVSGFIDDIGNTLFVLCAVAIIIGFTFVFIWLLLFMIVQLGVGKSF
ncbi:stage III sporulation protein AE [Solibacillus sp. CAU 1738]|uniref:stage III sporulation protein AE n=1 Tax=Solibacillus sp. CAU 1738 TaxID=3140363 RepID=UPI0032600CFA